MRVVARDSMLEDVDPACVRAMAHAVREYLTRTVRKIVAKRDERLAAAEGNEGSVGRTSASDASDASRAKDESLDEMERRMLARGGNKRVGVEDLVAATADEPDALGRRDRLAFLAAEEGVTRARLGRGRERREDDS